MVSCIIVSKYVISLTVRGLQIYPLTLGLTYWLDWCISLLLQCNKYLQILVAQNISSWFCVLVTWAKLNYVILQLLLSGFTCVIAISGGSTVIGGLGRSHAQNRRLVGHWQSFLGYLPCASPAGSLRVIYKVRKGFQEQHNKTSLNTHFQTSAHITKNGSLKTVETKLMVIMCQFKLKL